MDATDYAQARGLTLTSLVQGPGFGVSCFYIVSMLITSLVVRANQAQLARMSCDPGENSKLVTVGSRVDDIAWHHVEDITLFSCPFWT
jgi:hypothetical protein